MTQHQNQINFPEINGEGSGTTCGVFSYGWTSGCSYANGTNRGFTQDWFFDGHIGAWVSDTQVGPKYDNVNILGVDVTSAGLTYDVSLGLGKIHFISFVQSEETVETTLRFIDPPINNSFVESTLIVDNPSNPTVLNIVGVNNSGITGTVHMDRSDTSDAFDGLTYGIHMWKIWTIDGGTNYYMYRSNGFGRFWDDS